MSGPGDLFRCLRRWVWLARTWRCRCFSEFYCDWVEPYGPVPQAGCPRHD